MVRRPRIFLSHSSSRCTVESGCQCRRYLESLERHLAAGGCDPVADKRFLNGGDEWDEKVLKEIKTSHGMVVLISPHALTSHYVMKEAIVALAEQAGSDGAFLILPVLLPGVRRSQLKDSTLEKLNLGRFDMVDWSSAAGPGSPPEKIAASLRPLVERLGGVPYPEVTAFLAGRISDVPATVLEQAAANLGVPTLAHATDHSRHRVAQGLLTERPVRQPGDACALRSALKLLLPQVRHAEHRADIVDVAVPYARVPKADAERLRRVALGSGERVVLLPADHGETPDMYVRRASETPEPWSLCRPGPRLDVPGYVEGLVAEIRELLIEEIAWGLPCDDDALQDLLARHEKESGPFTVVLRRPPDPGLLDALLAHFPRLLFLFADRRAPASPGKAGQLRLEGMTPGQEQDMIRTHRQFTTRSTGGGCR
ncbi:toll/interleukin-1 receptor domain-containing protein [Streptomyces sp. NPDC056374]|uniref:toll/interleukin-1 receptor domain-containing protein n=1 Tax=unclassified Streptomyces TaxID=2593676 RepID=UPI0035DFE4D8